MDKVPAQNSVEDYAALEVKELVGLAIQKDALAIEALVRRYTPMLMGFLRARIPHHFEDVYQETLASALAELPKLRQHDRFGPWLITIAKRAAARRARNESRHAGPGLMNATAHAVRSHWHGSAHGNYAEIKSSLALSEAAQLALDAILKLPERYRLVVYLRLVHEKELRSIAEELGLRAGTVRARFRRGLHRVRKSLEKLGLREGH